MEMHRLWRDSAKKKIRRSAQLLLKAAVTEPEWNALLPTPVEGERMARARGTTIKRCSKNTHVENDGPEKKKLKSRYIHIYI